MKKTIKSFGFFAALVMLFMLSSANAGAYNCGSAVDKLCKVFDNMKGQVHKINSLEELDTLDFDQAMNKFGLDEVPDDCKEYVLTKEDKKKVITSLTGFMDAMSDKIYKLAGGMVSRDMINSEFAPMKSNLRKAVNSATTLGDMLDNINSVF